MLKKMLVFILCITMIPVVFVYGEEVGAEYARYERAFYRTDTLGILGECSEDFDFSDQVTRAESAVLAMGLAGFDYSSMGRARSEFDDVSSDYWAKDAIMAAYSLSILNGMGDGTFLPEAYVTYEQVIKMIVSTLNYEALAAQKGGYPMGYLSAAASLGLLRNVSVSGTDIATKGEIVLILDNALSVRPVQEIYSNGQVDYVIDSSQKTKLETLLEEKQMKNIRDVVNATPYTSITEEGKVGYGKVRVGTDVYQAGSSGIYSYLGCEVDAYAKSEDNGSTYTITHVRLLDNRNNMLEIEAEHIQQISRSKVKYWGIDDGRNHEESIDSVGGIFIYNGKKILLDETDLQVHNGKIKLIDNNNDGLYDVVLLEDYQSFLVDRIQNATIYFQDNQTLRDSRGLKIEINDRNYLHEIFDAKGNAVSLDEIEEGQVISIFASSDLRVVKAVVNSQLVSGKVTSIYDAEQNSIDINGETYSITKDETGAAKMAATIGDEADYALDAMGDIVGVYGEVYSGSRYAYIIGGQAASGLGGTMSIKVVSDSLSNRIVEVKNGIENISYEFKNMEITVLAFADKAKIKLDEVGVSLSDLRGSDFNEKVIKYTLNGENKISQAELTSIPASKVSYSFNPKITSFGGLLGDDGFLADETTSFFCIPYSAAPGGQTRTVSDEDYFEVVALAKNSTTMALGIDVDEETQVAGAILLFEDMNASEKRTLKPDTKVSVVSEVSMMLNEANEQEYVLSILTGDKIEKRIISENSLFLSLVRTLSKGDLIQYNADSTGKVIAMKEVGSVNGWDRYDRIGENTPSEVAYCIAYRVKFNRLAFMQNEMVDELTVVFSGDGTGRQAHYNVLREDGPYIYVYEKARGLIRPGEIDEMQSYEEVASSASEVLLFANNNDPIAIVIIK